MIFISLGHWKQRPTKTVVAQTIKFREAITKEGVKFLATYWTLGKYDTVNIFEAKDEKAAMKALMAGSELMKTETLVAVTREEALKLVE